MPEAAAPKKCFVISQIDQDGTPNRIRADWVLLEIIKPVLEQAPHNFSVMRADEFPEPGMITSQIINAVLEWDLVIADLSGRNANAFYELALRHMAEKPVIHMIDKTEIIPFDVFEYRTVQYSITHPKDIQAAKAELRQQLDAVATPNYQVSNPVTKARGYQQLASSSDSKEKLTAQLIERVGRMETQLNQLNSQVLMQDPSVRQAVLHDMLYGKPHEVSSAKGLLSLFDEVDTKDNYLKTLASVLKDKAR